jgi:hypothetical protein
VEGKFSGFQRFISRNRILDFIVFLSLPNPDPRNSDTSCDQRSRSFLDLTVQIQSRFRISRNRGFCCQVAIPETPIQRSSFLEVPIKSDNISDEIPDLRDQRSRSSFLILTAAIKSRNRISRFRGSCCQVNWTFQSPDPRFSDEENQRSRSHSCFNGCD